jgi:glutamate-1-semialdehyde 2,1-aminomutase
MKAEGGYHGTHNDAQMSIHPHLEDSNPISRPKSIPDSKGIPKSVLNDVIIFPFNNQPITESLLKENKNDLAAVIVEPVMGAAGIISPKDDYLKFLRELTTENDILLIFDEVVTARLSRGGAQQHFNVIPDITAFGKLFGGGTPVGVLGGRDEIMMLYSPENEEFLSQSGTFNANPVTLVGGIATLELLNDLALSQLNFLGGLLKNEISNTFNEIGITAQVNGEGSLLNIHFTDKEVIDYRSASTSNVELSSLLYLSMLNHGIWIAPRLLSCISTPMARKEIVSFLEALRTSLSRMKPFIKDFAPHLIKN